MGILYVAMGGALGSVLRYLMANFIGHNLGNDFPYSVMIINITGSLMMGLFIGWLANVLPQNAQDIRLFVAVGVLGGFTTFSSFSLDAIDLYENGKLLYMGIYILGSVTLSLLGLLSGLYIVRAIS